MNARKKKLTKQQQSISLFIWELFWEKREKEKEIGVAELILKQKYNFCLKKKVKKILLI